MKQTNNAIKFLMAQYRAIFKHANIAMVTAMAAAALAAGQANAGPLTTLDGVTAGQTITFTGVSGDDGSTAPKKYESLTLTGPVATNDKFQGVQLVFKSGDGNTLKSGAIDLTGATLELSAAEATAVANNKIVVGEASTAANLKLSTLNVVKGTLQIGAGGDTVVNSVEAADITLGAADKAEAIVDLKKTAELKGNNLTLESGSTINLNDGSKVLSSTINVKAGTVAMNGSDESNASVFGGDESTIDITGGVVKSNESSGAKHGKIVGKKITLSGKGQIVNSGAMTIVAGSEGFTANGGTIEVSGGSTLSFQGKSVINSGTTLKVGAAGKLAFKGDTSIAEDAVFTNYDASAETHIVSDDNTSSKLSVSKAALAKLTKDSTNKIAVSGAKATNISELHLTDTDAAINLATSNGGIGILADNGESLGTKFANSGSGIFKVSAASVEFKNDKLKLANFRVAGDKIVVGKNGAFTLDGGASLQAGSALTIDGSGGAGLTVTDGAIFLDGGKGGSVTAKAVILNGTGGNADKAKLNILNGGEWTVAGDLTLTAGKVSVTDSTLKVTGDLTTTASKGSIQADNAVIDTVGGKAVALATGGVTLKNTSELKLESKDFLKENALDPSKFTGAITGDANTTISFVDAKGDKLTLSKDDFDKLEQSVGDGFKGLFNVNVTGITNAQDGMALGDVTNNAAIEAYEQVSVKQASATDVKNTNRSVGSVEVTGGNTLNMGTDTSLTLNNAKGGKLVYEVNNGVAQTGNVVFKDAGNSLTLAGSGEIGSITVDAGVSANGGNVTVGKAAKTPAAVTVKGNIGAEAKNSRVVGVTVNDNSSLKANNVYTTKLDLAQGSALTTAADGVVDVSGAATIMGNVDAGSLKLGDTSSIAGNASVDVATLELAGTKTLTIGKDGDAEGKGSSSAAVFADKFIMGAGSTLFVDPAYTEKASILAVQTIQSDAQGTDVSVANGNIVVGKNAAFGYGFDQAGFESVMADYLVDGKFVDPKKNVGGVANAFVLNKPLTIKSGNYVAVDANLTAAPATPTLNSLTLGKNSALIVTESAFEGGKAALTFGKIAATGGENVTDAKVIASENAKISLVGTFTVKSKDIKIFEAAQGTSGGGQVAVSGQAVTVEALGGLLTGTLAVGTNAGTLTGLSLSNDAETLAYDGVARPVGDMLLGIAKAEFDTVDNGVGYKFVTTTMGLPGGYKAIDAAAHAATYAGAQQAAVASVTTMADAMFGRVGAVGVEAASISATGSQTKGGVWLTPMYKSVDADGFNAEGASYGADVDLAGVAFGTDTVKGNMRFGAVFNIGSGDADGKGNGNGLKDEFDYYGFGVYSAMGFGNLALIGDASMTVISHEVEGLGLKGEADTTAVTMGLTGQYTVATPAVDVTPHLGARFIRLNTDSYDLVGEKGVVANTEFDVQNVFSIPVGVTLSKAFVTGGWSLAPSADLTVAFNTGDTEAKSNTRFTGINKNIGLNTEVLDEVTYGLTVGLGAQYGAFGTSFGINYTGSENTDSFGVNAQARYMF